MAKGGKKNNKPMNDAGHGTVCLPDEGAKNRKIKDNG